MIVFFGGGGAEAAVTRKEEGEVLPAWSDEGGWVEIPSTHTCLQLSTHDPPKMKVEEEEKVGPVDILSQF